MPRTTVPKDSRARVNLKRTPAISSSRAFGPKSPLVDKDIQSFLALCMSSWDDYTNEEKQDIIQSLPPSRRPQGAVTRDIASEYSSNSLHEKHGVLKMIESDSSSRALNGPPVPVDLIASDTYIKRAVARFKRDIADGYYEKSWQDKAKRAYEERSQGKFDDYLKQCASEMFTSTTGESGGSDDNEYESDEDFVIDQKESRKELKTCRTG